MPDGCHKKLFKNYYCFLLIKRLLFMCGRGNKALPLYKLAVSRRSESSENKMKVKHGK